MQDQSSPIPGPGAKPAKPAQTRAMGEQATGIVARLPVTPASSAIGAPRSGTRRKSVGRLITAVLLFVLILGGLAWLVQYLPSLKKNDTIRERESNPLVFQHTHAIWDPDDVEDEKGSPGYAMEYEFGEDGHYDFPFENTSSDTVELGFKKPSCDCAKVQVALLSSSEWAQWEQLHRGKRWADRLDDSVTSAFPWQVLAVSEKIGVDVPGQAKGLVRVCWHSRKPEGQSLRLTTEMWAQPKGTARRDFVTLETRSRVVPPVAFTSYNISVGTLAPGAAVQKDVMCWSPTRPKFKLELGNQKNKPLIDCQVFPLTAQQCADLERALRGLGKETDSKKNEPEVDTRVRSGYRVMITVSEQKDGKQFDQGPFREFVPARVDGNRAPRATLSISGKVQGDVDIRLPQGKIELGSFSGKSGTKRTVLLWTERDVDLKLVKQYPRSINVTLSANPKDSSPQRKSWELRVEIPPGSQTGPLPDSSVIILQTQSTTPRYIRIPVVGTAVQG